MRIGRHAGSSRPFLAVVWFGNPHAPHETVEQDLAPYQDQSAKLRHFYGEIAKQYPEDQFPGHAAWLDWPWKFHRIEKNDKVTFELYNLTNDPQESTDSAATTPGRVASMKTELERWLKSVVQSLNGKDYV